MKLTPLMTGLGLCVSMLLSACGGGSDDVTLLSGSVSNSQGVAVANAQVVAMDRQNNQKFTAFADAQGRYQLSLPHGHYDLMADDSAQMAATAIGLVTLEQAEQRQDLALPEATEAISSGLASGRVWLEDGRPAAYYRLTFSSTVYTSDDDATLEKETTTDAEGRFSLEIGGERVFDIDVYDAQDNFVEFIDLHKLDGPLRINLYLGDASDDNLYRHNQGLITGAASVAPAYWDRGFPSVNEPFEVSVIDANWRACNEHGSGGVTLYDCFSYRSKFSEGEISPFADYMRYVAASVPSEADVNVTSTTHDSRQSAISGYLTAETILSFKHSDADASTLDMRLDDDAGWFNDWAIHFITGPKNTGTYSFTDATGQELKQDNSNGVGEYFKLNFKSVDPRIREIHVYHGWRIYVPWSF